MKIRLYGNESILLIKIPSKWYGIIRVTDSGSNFDTFSFDSDSYPDYEIGDIEL